MGIDIKYVSYSLTCNDHIMVHIIAARSRSACRKVKVGTKELMINSWPLGPKGRLPKQEFVLKST